MNITRLFIPGSFQDSYLYRNWFVGLTGYRSLKFVDMRGGSERLRAFFASAVSSSPESDGESAVYGSPTPEGSGGIVSEERLPQGGVFAREVDLEVGADVVLDLAVYRHRLYVGTDKGLFVSDLDLSPYGMRFRGTLDKRHDGRAMKVTARFDTVAVSCGQAGLYAAFRTSDVQNEKIQLKRIDKESMKTAWLYSSLVNYPNHRMWEILPAREELWAGGDEHWRVAEFPVAERFSLSSLVTLIQTHNPEFSEDDVQFSFNSDRYIFIHTFRGDFFSLRLGKRNGLPRVFFHRTYKGTGVRILGASPLGNGVVIETNNRVFLFANEQWFQLHDGEVLSVRTYPTSLKFRNVISIATEEGLHLISSVPERLKRQKSVPEY